MKQDSSKVRLSQSYAVFKKPIINNLLLAKDVFGIENPRGLPELTQLRSGLNKLNHHKFTHGFFGKIVPQRCPNSDDMSILSTFHYFNLPLVFC